MDSVDIVRKSVEATSKAKQQSNGVSPSNYVNWEYQAQQNVFCPSSTPSAPEVPKLFVNCLKERGFAVIRLPSQITDQVRKLEQQANVTIYSSDESTKRKMTKIFRKSNIFKNYLSYSFLSGPGKESWRFRSVNPDATETISIPMLPELDLLVEATYNYLCSVHALALDLAKVLDSGLGSENYISDHCEPVLHYDLLPFGLSHVNLLRYFDVAKPVPVQSHTDQYLFTILPLNTANPALDVWDNSTRNWANFEATLQQPPFTFAIVLVGETLSRISNDYFVSSVHRVLSPPSSLGRFSCPFFFSAKKGQVLDASKATAIFKNTSATSPSPPIEVADFLWECTQSQNQNEVTIMKRYEQSRQSHNDG